MDQARHYICKSCMTAVPRGHKFCGRCGEPLPEHALLQTTRFFSDMQDPNKARLTLIQGEINGQGMEGLSYHLKADQHIVGRNGQVEFPDDRFVSPTHANFFYRNNRLVVRDEGSLNGVYVRIRGAVDLAPGDTFMVGSQVLRFDKTPNTPDAADPEGTYFYTSPRQPGGFRVTQLLASGGAGITVCTKGATLRIGQEDSDLNFPDDPYVDAKHCTIEEVGGRYRLTDHGSRNGTYVRIKSEVELGHGDYVFIGKKLLRVELNA
jgi:pSer/pThr/pTyr-binding forkhead associated (FHA) protein